MTALRPKAVYAAAAQSLRDSLKSRTCPKTVNSLIRLRGHRPHIQPSAATLTASRFGYSGQELAKHRAGVERGVRLSPRHLLQKTAWVEGLQL